MMFPDRLLEISMFEGREPETKRRLLERLMAAISDQIGIPVQDIEITIFETPKANWGIRGKTADKLILDYKVET
jgi:4-oxalocrotonate tautomerase family enzyme